MQPTQRVAFFGTVEAMNTAYAKNLTNHINTCGQNRDF